MGVTKIVQKNIDGRLREYARVTRTWDGKERQFYYRDDDNTENGRRSTAVKLAENKDKELSEQQTAFWAKKEYHLSRYIKPDGKIIGMGRVFDPRDSDIFTLRAGDPVKKTSISITKHGFNAAFDQAVQWMCEHSPVHTDLLKRAMMGSRDHYLKGGERAFANPKTLRASDYFNENGTVKGIHRHEGIISLNAHDPDGLKNKNTSFSIAEYGIEGAFELAVHWVCEKKFKNMTPEAELIEEAMMKTLPLYDREEDYLPANGL